MIARTAGLLVMVAVSLRPQPEPKDEDIRDAVSRSLGAMLGVPAQQIELEVTGGRVTLSGGMPSVVYRWIARETAASVEGVRAVANEMTVAPQAGSDRELGQQVVELLQGAPATTHEPITVNCQHHVISLDGEVANDAVALRAEDLALSVRGVLDVANHLRRQDTALGAGPQAIRRAALEQIGGPEARPDTHVDVAVVAREVVLTGRVAVPEERRRVLAAGWVAGVRAVDGRGVVYRWWSGRGLVWRPPARDSDDALRRELLGALGADDRFIDLRPSVEVAGAVVTLRGRAASRGLARAAEALAWALPGVLQVRSQLAVDPGFVVSDGIVERAVRERLIGDPFVGGRRIHVTVRRGQVTLSGAVKSWSELVRAQYLAGGVPGVTSVESELHLPPAEWPTAAGRRAVGPMAVR